MHIENDKILEKESLLTTYEAARLLRVAESTLRNWRRGAKYDLKFYKVGRNYRYKLIDLHHFLNEHMNERWSKKHAQVNVCS